MFNVIQGHECQLHFEAHHCKKRVFRNTKLSGNPAATRLVHPNTQFGCFAQDFLP